MQYTPLTWSSVYPKCVYILVPEAHQSGATETLNTEKILNQTFFPSKSLGQ